MTASLLDGLRALLIDGSSLSKNVLSRLLRDFGFAEVRLAAHPDEARRMIRDSETPYDVVLSEYNFPDAGKAQCTGQDLLEELRQSRGLPMHTAFVMVTAEARYQLVVDSVEGALDDYILKPFTPGRLHERLTKVVARKKALAPIFACIEAEDYGAAAALCDEFFERHDEHSLFAARIGSELYIRLGEHDKAARMFEQILAVKAMPWVRLGLARVHLASGKAKAASRALETLIAENPAYADAYDVLGRTQMADLDFDAAEETYALAVRLTPGNIARQQKLGLLALLNRHYATALDAFSAALRTGAHSRALDYATLAHIVLASAALGRQGAYDIAQPIIVAAVEARPESSRVQFLRDLMQCLGAFEERRLGVALSRFTALIPQTLTPEFDFDLGCALVLFGAHLAAVSSSERDIANLLGPIASRFAVSEAAGGLLVHAAGANPTCCAVVRNSLLGIEEALRSAVSRSLEGEPAKALDDLVAFARSSRNARVFAAAGSLLERYRDRLSEMDARRFKSALQTAGEELGLDRPGIKTRMGSPVTQAAVQGSDQDAPVLKAA